MSEPAFGWAIISRSGTILLPVMPTRVGAVASFVHSINDAVPGPQPSNGTALGLAQLNAWRRSKWNYGVRAARVRITEAFGDRHD